MRNFLTNYNNHKIFACIKTVYWEDKKKLSAEVSHSTEWLFLRLRVYNMKPMLEKQT